MITLSVVIRFHEGANISLLRRALYCLLDEATITREAIVVVQFTNAEVLAEVTALCASLFDGEACRVAGVEVASGADQRGRLLAEGAALARGEYIAFLDHDDMLFLNAVALSIEMCRAEGADVAISQCLVAYVEGIFPRDYMVTKEKFVTRIPPSALFLLVRNFAPICAWIVSREFIIRTGITFAADLVRLEDYEFLVRALAAGRVTISPLAKGIVNGQYNFNVDVGGTTLMLCIDEDARKREEPTWAAARERVQATMASLDLSLDLRSMKQLLDAATARAGEGMTLNLPAFVERVRNERKKA